MRLEGQYSGFNYDMSNYRGAAKYILDAFEASCQINDEYSYSDIEKISASDLINTFCPDFVLEDDGDLVWSELVPHVERERVNLHNRITGRGGQAIALTDYNGQEVDDLLLEKSIDFLLALESANDYNETLATNKDVVAKVMAIQRKYGEQIYPLTLENMQETYYGIIGSGKYTSSPVILSVARSSLSRAWDGMGGWRV